MTAPISTHDGLITRRSIFIGAAAVAAMRACHRAGRGSYASAQPERTDWATVCRVLRAFDVSKSRAQLESRPNEHGSQWQNNS